MLSPKFIRLLKKLIPHIVLWFTACVLYIVLEKGILGDSSTYPSTGNLYDFNTSLFAVLTIGIFGGLTFGLIEEVLFKNFLQEKSFGIKLLLKSVLYVVLLIVLLLMVSTFFNSRMLEVPLFHPISNESTLSFITDFVFLSIIIYSGAFITLSLFVSEVLDHIGINAVTNFFTGKYARSKVEKRIFMFLDMRSSTTIAEKLGHEDYYRLLNTYYKDMTNPIINTSGEIYQYVGDEIVVSWKYSAGIKNNSCIRCFFLIKDQLDSRKDFYIKKFGLAPEFKAGLHFGEVTTGEVGIIRKEILFTGDVLNTTARIQSLCNEQRVDLLISGTLKDELDLERNYEVENKGSFELRGRDQKIELFTINRTESA